MTITVPGVVVSSDAVIVAIRADVGEPELEFHALDDAEFDATAAVLERYPHVQPGLAELADGLLLEETR